MDVKNNQLIFNIKDNKVSVKSRGPMTLEDIIQVTMTGILAAMHSCVKTAPAEQQAELKGYIYDKFNEAAGRTLTIFGPEFEAQAHLTTDAILKAENDLLAAEIAKKEEDPDYEMKY